MNVSDFFDFLKPELLVLIPVCWGVGLILKNWPSFADKAIPPILGVVAIILSAIWVFANSPIYGYQDALTALFAALTQGVIASLLSNVTYDKFIQQMGSDSEPNDAVE